MLSNDLHVCMIFYILQPYFACSGNILHTLYTIFLISTWPFCSVLVIVFIYQWCFASSGYNFHASIISCMLGTFCTLSNILHLQYYFACISNILQAQNNVLYILIIFAPSGYNLHASAIFCMFSTILYASVPFLASWAYVLYAFVTFCILNPIFHTSVMFGIYQQDCMYPG
jgi:hypothetical protein